MQKPLLFQAIAFITMASFLALPQAHLNAKTARKSAVKASYKQGAAPTAASLVADMNASVIFIVKNSRDINQRSKQARPFWTALQTITEGIGGMEAGIEAKNADMVRGLEITGRGITQLSATWGMIRGAHPKSSVGRGVIALASSYEMFQNYFGPAAARVKKRGKLTKNEITLVNTCDAQLNRMLPTLERVANKARPNSYQQRMIIDLLNLLEELIEIDGNSVRGYAKYMYQWNRIQNAFHAYTDIVQTCYPEYYETWSLLDTDIQEMSTVFEEETSTYYESWDYTTVSIESYDDYYEETAITETVTEEEETQYEETIESYEEEEATEEFEEEVEEFEEEIEIEEDEEDSLFEEVEDSYDDDDGDGISDEEDLDDDNDGTADEEDTDDDGDGYSDEEDADTEEEEVEEMEEEDDDDGIAEEYEEEYEESGGDEEEEEE